MYSASPRHSKFKNLNFKKSKMADGRHFEKLKLPYLCNYISYCDEILHNDAYRQSAPYLHSRVVVIFNVLLMLLKNFF